MRNSPNPKQSNDTKMLRSENSRKDRNFIDQVLAEKTYSVTQNDFQPMPAGRYINLNIPNIKMSNESSKPNSQQGNVSRVIYKVAGDYNPIKIMQRSNQFSQDSTYKILPNVINKTQSNVMQDTIETKSLELLNFKDQKNSPRSSSQLLLMSKSQDREQLSSRSKYDQVVLNTTDIFFNGAGYLDESPRRIPSASSGLTPHVWTLKKMRLNFNQ